MVGTIVFGGFEETDSSSAAFDSSGLIDLLSAIERYNVPLLAIAPLRGLGRLGSGASGEVYQSIADITTTLAFKNAIPSHKRFDEDWYSLITELAILRHGPIKSNPYIADLVGISWEYKKVDNIGTIWPNTITKKATWGDLDSFLQDTCIDDATRLSLCAQVLQAVSVLHSCGVAHGDIKPKNVIVDKNADGKYHCQLVDFGGSAITGQERIPQGTIPWNAPELDPHKNQISRRLLPADQLLKADLFSLGLLIAHILIPCDVLAGSSLCLLGFEDNPPGEEWIDSFIKLRDKEALANIFANIAVERRICLSYLESLQKLLHGLLKTDYSQRRLDPLFEEHIASSVLPQGEPKLLPTDLTPPLMAVSSMTSSPCIHNVFQLELLLETFDGLDYVLSKDVADDMTRKARLTTCNECKKAYECQIAIYYRIGFGLARDVKESDCHRKLSDLSEFEFNEKLQNLETVYGTRALPTDIVEKELGIMALVGIDLVEQYQFTGRLTAAANATRNAIEAREREFGKESSSTVKLKATQAQIYKAQGFISKAEQIQHDVVSIYSKKFGEEDGFTLEANSALGLIIATQGSLMSAEQILRKVASKFEAGLSMKHPQTLFALQHLGTTLHLQGRYEDAAEIFRKITDVRRETLGEFHLLTIKAQIDLASALQAQGLLNDADALMREISQKGSYVGDPIIISLISLSLVDLYVGQGSMDLARNSAFRARSLLEQQLGDQDPLVWNSLESEAMVCGAKAEYKREEELIRKSISAKESLGDSSMSTLNSKISLSANLMRQAMLEESRAEIEGVIERLGDDFSFAPESVFRAGDLLAQCLWLLGEKAKAESEHQKLLNSFRNSFGDNHPLTLKSVKSFAAFYQGQSRWQDSIALISTFLDACRTTGKLTGAAIDLSTQLVLAYRERNQYKESISLCEEAIDWSIQTVGPKHNDTLALKNLLAGTYFYMGQTGKAEQLFQILKEEVAGRYMEMYVVSNLADVKTQQKAIGEAKALLERAIDLAQRWKDKGHPDVIKARGSLLGLRLNHERVTKELLDEVDKNIEEKIKTFGLDHPTTFKTITDKADALLSVGDLDGSRALYGQLENLDTVNILQNKLRYATYVAKLANAFFHRKGFEKCEQLERQAFEIRKQVLEPDSPAILTSMANLASVLCQQGKLEEAETFMKHVATVRCERDGRESLLSLDAMNDLASIYYLEGRLQESVAIFEENLEISERIRVESPQAILNRQVQLSQAQRSLRERLSKRTE